MNGAPDDGGVGSDELDDAAIEEEEAAGAAATADGCCGTMKPSAAICARILSGLAHCEGGSRVLVGAEAAALMLHDLTGAAEMTVGAAAEITRAELAAGGALVVAAEAGSSSSSPPISALKAASSSSMVAATTVQLSFWAGRALPRRSERERGAVSGRLSLLANGLTTGEREV